MKTFRSMRCGQSYPGRPPLQWVALETPAGPVSVAADDEFVRIVELGRAVSETPRPGRLAREAASQLRAYFRRRRKGFALPLAVAATPFTYEVLEELVKIPYGRTAGYGEVARRIGRPGAARAVGQAVGANPLPVLIPCHRVLAAGRRIGGFGSGLDWKRFLLARERIDWSES